MSVLTAESVAQAIRDLPPMPAVVVEILSSIGRDSLNAEDMAKKLTCDQALTAKTLKLANSPFYGVSRQITSVQEAIAILGLRTVRSIVVASAVMERFKSDKRFGLDFGVFWKHSVATSLCAQAIAIELNDEADSAFTLGLLHDIGRLALAALFPEEYRQAVSCRERADCCQHEAELLALGLDHAQIGGKIAEHWCFPADIVCSVAGHHMPMHDQAWHLAAMVHVADNMVHALDLVGDEHEVVPTMDLLAWYELGLTDEQCLKIFKATESQLEDICAALVA